MYSIAQKLVAEFLGTFALIFFGAGSKEDQGKRAEKFRNKFLRDAVHGDSSRGGKEDAPKSNGCILAAKVRGTPAPPGNLGNFES